MNSDNVTPVAHPGTSPESQGVSIGQGNDSRRRKPKPARPRKRPEALSRPAAIELFEAGPVPTAGSEDDPERGQNVDVCA